MTSSRWRVAGSLFAAAATLTIPSRVSAQTANGSPTAPAPPGLVGTPRPVSRTAPSVGSRAKVPGATVQQQLPKPTAAERAEQRKLEQDLRICIGC